MENLTIQQALQNIEAVIAMYKGTKQEHIVLEQSVLLIKKSLEPKVEDK